MGLRTRRARALSRRDRRLGELAQCPTRPHQLDVHNRKSPRQNGSSISQARNSSGPGSKSQNLCDEVLAAIAENVNAQVNTIDAEPAELNRLLEVLRT